MSLDKTTIEKENMKGVPSVLMQHFVSKNWTMSNVHFHDHYELNLAISGGNRFFINDRTYTAKKGDLFFFSDRDLHRNMVETGADYERYLIFIDPLLLSAYSTDRVNLMDLFHLPDSPFKNRLRLNGDELLTLTQLLDDTIYQSKTTYNGNELYMTVKLIEVLLFIRSIFIERLAIKSSNTTIQPARINTLHPIIDYINHSLSTDLRLDTLASMFYINKSYLCKKFKDETGFTVNQYITNRRILKARQLLTKGMPVTQTAYEVGYNNDAHFIRVFKNMVGTTPKQYGKR